MSSKYLNIVLLSVVVVFNVGCVQPSVNEKKLDEKKQTEKLKKEEKKLTNKLSNLRKQNEDLEKKLDNAKKQNYKKEEIEAIKKLLKENRDEDEKIKERAEKVRADQQQIVLDKLNDLSKNKNENAYREVGQIWGDILKKEYGEKIEQQSIEDIKNIESTRFIYFLLTKKMVKEEEVESSMLKEIQTVKDSYYFGIHNSLKKAFQDGFRDKFQSRKADFILGAQIQQAAKSLGITSVNEFTNIIKDYRIKEEKLALAIAEATEKYKITSNYSSEIKLYINNLKALFKEIIAEGSRSDRVEFMENFKKSYGLSLNEKENSLIQKIKNNSYCAEGNTRKNLQEIDNGLCQYEEEANSVLHRYTGFLNRHKKRTAQLRMESNIKKIPRLNNMHLNEKIVITNFNKRRLFNISHNVEFKTLSTIPTADEFWKHIYVESLIEVGKEMADKFSHNLITRVELINWVRRVMMSATNPDDDKKYIGKGFISKDDYGTTESMYKKLIADLGL